MNHLSKSLPIKTQKVFGEVLLKGVDFKIFKSHLNNIYKICPREPMCVWRVHMCLLRQTEMIKKMPSCDFYEMG